MFITDDSMRKRHWRPVVLTAIGVMILIGGFAFWQARPLYNFVQKQQALKLVDEIRDEMDDERYTEAHKLAFEAYHLAPTEPEVLRVSSQLAMQMRSPETTFFIEKLVEMGEATFDDRCNLLEAYARLDDFERALELGRELLQENSKDLRMLNLLAEVSTRMERPFDAMQVLARIVELDPDNTKRRLQYARLLILHGNGEQRTQGWRFVGNIATQQNELGIAAIDMLLLGTNFPPEVEDSIAGAIENHSLAEERHRVAALGIRVKQSPDTAAELIRAAAEERRSWAPEEMMPFYRWLNNEERYEEILKHLTLEEARGNESLLVVHFNALGHSGNWEKVRELLKDTTLPISGSRRHLFSALCAQRLDEDETLMEEALQLALRAATRRGAFHEAYHTGLYAETTGLDGLAEIAYKLAQRSPAVADRAFIGRQRLATAEGNTPKLRKVTANYHYHFPRRTEINERYLYLNTLVGLEIETSLEKAIAIIEEEPFRVAPRIIASLAYLRMGDIPSAVQTCQPCKVEAMSDSEKAVFAAVAGAANQPDLARQIAQMIAADELLAEERALIERWL